MTRATDHWAPAARHRSKRARDRLQLKTWKREKYEFLFDQEVDAKTHDKVTPQDVIREWKLHFSSFWPKGNTMYVPAAGSALYRLMAHRPDMPGAVPLPSPRSANRSRHSLPERCCAVWRNPPLCRLAHSQKKGQTNMADTTRKPMLLLRLFGLFLLRYAARALS